MSSIKCPVKTCGQDIDDDSLYCDQCGAQILVCASCGRLGTGKRCIFDGNQMVVKSAAGSSPASVSAPAVSAAPNPTPAAPVSAPVTQAAPAVSSALAAGTKIKLSAQSQGIVIEANASDILGRTK